MIRVRTDNGLEGIGEADSSPEMAKGADGLAVILTPDEWDGLLPNPDYSHL
ncbi:MAG TPA: hypothetical protein VNQ76_19640 [Planctomicrobium sp.]|nr:hypothetical protein [Planctomicrobium sp.]